MTCGRVDRLIERYLDGRLPASVAGATAAHLGRCERCAARLAAARVVEASLRAPERVRAPETLSSSVMAAVYREERGRRRRAERTPEGARTYRRLGYSFVATAAVLAASLLVPHVAYPRLLQRDLLADSLGAGKPAAVARFVQDAGLHLGAVLDGGTGSGNR